MFLLPRLINPKIVLSMYKIFTMQSVEIHFGLRLLRVTPVIIYRQMNIFIMSNAQIIGIYTCCIYKQAETFFDLNDICITIYTCIFFVSVNIFWIKNFDFFLNFQLYIKSSSDDNFKMEY